MKISPTREMRVSHICVNYGAPFFHELFLALNKHGIEQGVFYPRNKKHLERDSDGQYGVYSPLVLNMATKISFRRKRRIMLKQYDRIFLSNKPNLIHAHTLFSDGSLANHYYKKHGIPFIVAFRSTDLEYFLKYKPWLKGYGKQIIENAKYVIFISPSLKKKFLKVYGGAYESKSLIVPNGIHPSFFIADEFKKKELQSTPELLYVGSFLKRKNVPSLIRLVETCRLNLTIAGKGGKDEDKVLRMIRNAENVNYLGQIEDRSRLIEIYRQSDIFLMASKGETFGLSYIEAMSQGLPVIYSKDTGIDGLFEQGSVGYAVKPGSLPEMKLVLDKILANYHEISSNCLIQAKRFNWKQIAQSYVEIYAEINK